MVIMDCVLNHSSNIYKISLKLKFITIKVSFNSRLIRTEMVYGSGNFKKQINHMCIILL